MSQGWCTIESDPGVFTALIKGIGVKGIIVEELYTLDDQKLLDNMQPIFGLIFLFKWQEQKHEANYHPQYQDQNVYFIKQVINNACATQAIISVLLNRPDIDIGQTLSEFKSFTGELDSENRGICLSNSARIRNVHNSYSRPEPLIIEHDPNDKSEGDAFHFIAYVPVKGKLYELDGLQPSPLSLGQCSNENWLEIAKKHIQGRIQQYQTNEIKFNLMAICGSKSDKAKRELSKISLKQHQLFEALIQKGGKMDENQVNDAKHCKALWDTTKKEDQVEVDIPEKAEDVLKSLQDLENVKVGHNFEIEQELNKLKKFQRENVRRQHNYIPFIMELFKICAQKGHLKDLIKEGTKKRIEKIKAKKEKEAKELKDAQEASLKDQSKKDKDGEGEDKEGKTTEMEIEEQQPSQQQ